MKFSFLFFYVFSIFSEEFIWDEKIVQIKNVSSFASEFKLLDKQKKNLFYETLLGFNKLKKKRIKILDKKNILFLQVETSGEGFLSESLHYFIFTDGKLNQGLIESAPNFKVKKKSKLLYINKYKHWKIENFICKNEKIESNYGFPEIFKFQEGRFVKLKREEYLLELKKYYFQNEKKNKIKFSKLVLLYYIQKKLNLKSNKDFFKKEFEYSCETNPKQKIKFLQLIQKLR